MVVEPLDAIKIQEKVTKNIYSTLSNKQSGFPYLNTREISAAPKMLVKFSKELAACYAKTSKVCFLAALCLITGWRKVFLLGGERYLYRA